MPKYCFQLREIQNNIQHTFYKRFFMLLSNKIKTWFNSQDKSIYYNKDMQSKLKFNRRQSKISKKFPFIDLNHYFCKNYKQYEHAFFIQGHKL